MNLIDAFQEEYWRFKSLNNEHPVQSMIHPKTLSDLKKEVRETFMIPVDLTLDVFKLNDVEFYENIEMNEGEFKMMGLKPLPGPYELRYKKQKS